MAAILRRLPAVAGLAVLAGIGRRARRAPRVHSPGPARRPGAACPGVPGPGGAVTEEMLADLPEPVRRYLRYAGVVGRPFPGTIPLRQKGRMRPAPGRG